MIKKERTGLYRAMLLCSACGKENTVLLGADDLNDDGSINECCRSVRSCLDCGEFSVKLQNLEQVRQVCISSNGLKNSTEISVDGVDIPYVQKLILTVDGKNACVEAELHLNLPRLEFVLGSSCAYRVVK